MKTSFRLRAAVLSLLAACVVPGMAQEYVQQMPTPEQIAAHLRGTDEWDGKAQQAGALRAVQTMVSQAFSPSGLFEATVAEQALMQRYNQASSALEQAAMEALKAQGADAPKTWWKKVMAYEQDPAVHDALLELMPTALRTRYRSRMAEREQERVADSAARVVYDAEQEQAMKEQLQAMAERSTEAATRMEASHANHWWMVLAGLICLAGAVLGVVRELRSSGLDPEHPWHYRVGFARYELGGFIGTAAGTSYSSSSTRHSGRDHNNLEYAYTTSTEHQRFHLVARNGDQVPVHRINSSLGVIDGNLVGMIVLKVKGRAHELVYNNYSTSLMYVQPSFITAFNPLGLLAAGGAAFFLISYRFSGFLSAVTPGSGAGYGGSAAEYTLGVVGALPVMLAYLTFGVVRARQRRRELRTTVLPPLLAELHANAWAKVG
jgi:hypothetical protein